VNKEGRKEGKTFPRKEGKTFPPPLSPSPFLSPLAASRYDFTASSSVCACSNRRSAAERPAVPRPEKILSDSQQTGSRWYTLVRPSRNRSRLIAPKALTPSCGTMTAVAAASSVLIVVFFNSVVAQVNFPGAVNACFSCRISIIGA
jgi:hypothetical protein